MRVKLFARRIIIILAAYYYDWDWEECDLQGTWFRLGSTLNIDDRTSTSIYTFALYVPQRRLLLVSNWSAAVNFIRQGNCTSTIGGIDVIETDTTI